MCFEKCSIRFLSVPSGIWALSVQERVAEDAAQPLGVGGFDGLEGVEQRPADIPRGSAHILPVRALGNREAVVGGGGRVAGVARVLEGLLVVLVPHVAESRLKKSSGKMYCL